MQRPRGCSLRRGVAHAEVGVRFRLLDSVNEVHKTPFGTSQQFLTISAGSNEVILYGSAKIWVKLQFSIERNRFVTDGAGIFHDRLEHD
jgi:hypothetical protein